MKMKTALPVFRTFSAAVLSVTFAFGLIVPPLAFAELSNESLLGPGLRSQPAYDGSASQSVEFVPVIRYFGEYWFARSTQGVLEGGGRLELAPGLHAGAQLAYEPGRETSKSDFLENHNLSDVDAGASVGVQLEWDHKFGPMPITLLGRARQNIDSDLGAQADLRLSAGVFHSGRFSAGIFTQTTFANAKSAGSFYDITPQQSATTGLPEFQAGSGLLFASVGLLWSVDVSQDWIVVGSMESRHLQGDAEHSPLAADRITMRAWASPIVFDAPADEPVIGLYGYSYSGLKNDRNVASGYWHTVLLVGFQGLFIAGNRGARLGVQYANIPPRQ